MERGGLKNSNINIKGRSIIDKYDFNNNDYVNGRKN